jgi:hypothetical protein
MSKALHVVGLHPTTKLVLVGIANHDGDGGAWPSVATLAKYAGVSERSVQRQIQELVKFGLVTVEMNCGGNRSTRTDRRPNMYHLHLDGVTPMSSRDGVTPVTPRGDTGDADGVTPVTERGDAHVTRTVLEPSIEPSKEVSVVCDADAPPEKLLCEMLADAIEHHGGKRPTVSKAWVTEMERMIRIDAVPPTRIASCIRWLVDGKDSVAIFWAPNIRSPQKLRLNFDQMKAQKDALGKTAKPESTMDRIRRANS